MGTLASSLYARVLKKSDLLKILDISNLVMASEDLRPVQELARHQSNGCPAPIWRRAI